MKIFRAEPFAEPRAGAGDVLLSFAGSDGAPGRWLLLEGGAVAVRGEAEERPAANAAVRAALAVPGEDVAIHWIALAEGLAPAQAAAAARLMLADASAEPIAAMHVAVGRPERGLTPVALVPAARMEGWIAAARAAGLDPDPIVPAPMLLVPPEEGLVRRDGGPVPDYRGLAAAFSMEPELADLVAPEAAVETIGEERFEAGLGEALAAPVLNLRQGRYARRRQWKLERGRLRRLALLVFAFAAATLVVQVATILRYTFAADRLEDQAATIGIGAPTARGDPRIRFGAAASALFETIRATPNVELTRIDYRRDGSLAAALRVDNAATLAALRQRIEQSGFAVEGGALQGGGGRPAAELVLRPA